MPKAAVSVVESRGFFWWQDEPKEDYRFAPTSAVPGLLVIEEGGQITLTLDGSLLQAEYPKGLPFFPDQVDLDQRSLAGTVTDERGGSVHLSDVSLRDYHKQSDGRITMEKYGATSCLVGFSISAPVPKPLVLSKQSVSLRGLQEWRCRHAIEATMTQAEELRVAQEVSYSLERNVYEIDNGTLTVRSDVYCTPISCMLRSLRPLASKSLSVPRERTPPSPACDSPLSILQMRSLDGSLQEIRSERSYVPSYPVPSNDGYSVIPLGDAEGKPVKSIHIYQDDEALNVDLGFKDKSMLEMIFRVGFRSTINLLENHDGDYHIRKRIKPKRSAE